MILHLKGKHSQGLDKRLRRQDHGKILKKDRYFFLIKYI